MSGIILQDKGLTMISSLASEKSLFFGNFAIFKVQHFGLKSGVARD
jgi:hypothetical protein